MRRYRDFSNLHELLVAEYSVDKVMHESFSFNNKLN